MDILQFNLRGQRLVSNKDAKSFIAADSNGYAEVFVDGIDEGFEATAHFRQSWTGVTYSRSMTDGTASVDEEITALPSPVNDYVDYKIMFSVSAVNANGIRLTTNELPIYIMPNGYTQAQGGLVLPYGASVIKQVTETSTMTYEIGRRYPSVTLSLMGDTGGGLMSYAYYFILKDGQSSSVNTKEGYITTIRYADGVVTFEGQRPSQRGCIVGND